MDAYFLCAPSRELEELSIRFGYTKALFLDRDFVYSELESLKDAQKLVSRARALRVSSVGRVVTDCVREVVEKSSVTVIVGLEGVAPKDSLHQVRGGLDQVLGPLLFSHQVSVMFSLGDVLLAPSAQLISRMRFNLMVCTKYKVDVTISCLCSSKYDLRSVSDVEAFFRVVRKK